MKKIMLLCIAFFTILTPIYAEKSFKNNKYGVNLTIPNEWAITPTATRMLLSMEHEDGTSSINVMPYIFPEDVTINGFQRMHMTSRYDSWQNLMERELSIEEAQRANVEEGKIAIYSKSILDDNFQVSNLLVVDYYYLVNPKKGFVVSIRTYKSLWPTVKNQVRTILNSFWVGSGERIDAPKTSKEAIGWEHIGSNSNNQNFIESSLDYSKGLSESWIVDLPNITSDPNKESLLVTRGDIYYNQDSELMSLSIITGKENWRFNLNKSIEGSLAYYDDILYFILKERQPLFYALHATNGSVIYKKEIPHGNYTSPIANQNKLYLQNQDKLIVWDAESGSEKWVIDGDFNKQFYPVVSGNSVLVVDKRKILKNYNSKNGDLLWEKEFDDRILFSPIILRDLVIVGLTDNNADNKRVHHIYALNINDGAQVWDYQLDSDSGRFNTSISAGKNTVIFTLDVDDRNTEHFQDRKLITALDSNTGEKLWEKESLAPKNARELRSVVTDKFVCLPTTAQNNQTTLSSVDLITGEPSDLWSSNIEENPIQSIEDIKILKNKIILITKNNRDRQIRSIN